MLTKNESCDMRYTLRQPYVVGQKLYFLCYDSNKDNSHRTSPTCMTTTKHTKVETGDIVGYHRTLHVSLSGKQIG